MYRDPGEPAHRLGVVGGDEVPVLLEGHRRRAACLAGVLRTLLQRVFRPQAVADVGVAALEARVAADEVVVHPVAGDDPVCDEVEDREVRLWREHDREVGQIETAVLERGQHRDLDVGGAQAPVGDPGPEDRVHLRHVRAPEHEYVGRLDVVVAAHRLVHAESPHEAADRGRHAVARVRVDVVRAEACLEELGRRVALPYRPLSGAEHADPARPLLAQRLLELLLHHVEGGFPGDRPEIALLVEGAVAHTKERSGEPVFAVEDLGEEIALDAVEPAVDLRLDVAMGGDHLAFLHRHVDAAPDPAEPAGRLCPVEAGVFGVGDQVGGPHRGGKPRRRCGACRGRRLDEGTA